MNLKKRGGGGKMRGGGYVKNLSWYRGGTCRR